MRRLRVAGGGYRPFRAIKESDPNMIRVGTDRHEIPDAEVLGG